MSPAKNSALRLAVYGLFIAYLMGDLFLFHGPISRRIELGNPFSAASIEKAKSEGVVARVFNHQITRNQLDRAVAERLWISGRDPESISPTLKKTIRYAALNDLIDHELLRVKAKVNAYEFPATDEEIEQRMLAFRKRFRSEESMLEAMKSQGLGDIEDLRDRLAARIQQDKYAASKIDELVDVDEADAKAWFNEHHREFDIPERVRARHIFLPSLEADKEASLNQLHSALTQLTAKENDFATLAKELSEDPRTRNKGGDLGWFTRDRLPDDFTKPVFDMPLHQAQVIETSIGWHLVEVMERRAATPQPFEAVKPQIIAALTAILRKQAVNDYRTLLRQFQAKRIQIFHDKVME